jgi:hypothetical protein
VNLKSGSLQLESIKIKYKEYTIIAVRTSSRIKISVNRMVFVIIRELFIPDAK